MYDIIDAHVHTYPTSAIGLQATGGMNMSGCAGTVQELLALMSVGGIDKAAMMNMTPVADMREAALTAGKVPYDDVARQMIERMKRRNDWTCQTAREQPSLVPFISLDPSMGPEGATAEVHRCREQGAVGIKLHPSSQRFNPDDPNLWPVYAEAESLEMPVLSHGGFFPADPESSEFSRPRAFARILEAFPKLRFVLAHMGQGYIDESLAMGERFAEPPLRQLDRHHRHHQPARALRRRGGGAGATLRRRAHPLRLRLAVVPSPARPGAHRDAGLVGLRSGGLF